MGFFDYIEEVPKELAERVTKAIEHAVEAIKDGSQAAYEEVSKELAEIREWTNQKTWDHARDEVKEQVMRNLQELGESTEDAESKVKELWDKAEKLRKMLKPARLVWLKALAAGTAALGLLVFAISSGFQKGTNLRSRTEDWGSRNESSQLNMQLRMDRQEFDNMLRSLEHPPSVAVPMAVAAIETKPVTATIMPPSGNSYVMQTTVGNVYRSVPGARHEIESRVVSSPRHDIHGHINVNPGFGGGSASAKFDF